MTMFFQDRQPGVVWHPEKNRAAAYFVNGEFETDDPALADLLVRAGYRFNGTLPEPEKPKKPAAAVSTKPKMVRRKK